MVNVRVYFRDSELEQIQQEYYKNTELIKNEAENYFSSVTSLSDLHFKVSLLENSEKILNGLSIREQQYYGSENDPYIDPFSQSPSDVYGINFTGSEFIFYLTIFVAITFLGLLFSNLQRLRKVMFIVLIGLIGYNIVNYYIVEPNIITDIKSNINVEKYRSDEYERQAYATLRRVK